MGHGATTTSEEVIDGVELGGRVALVTGASSGLGLETARALALAGAEVVLAVRSDEKGRQAAGLIRETVPGARLDHVAVDLGSLASVRAAAERFGLRHPRLHVLVNNAGVMFTPFGRTAEGFETQLGVNHLGHFLLTNLLVPQLLAGTPARVVNLSSAGHRASDVHWDDPNYHQRPYDKFEAYGQSKTANILFTVALDRRLAQRGVRSFAVHPGMVATALGRHMTRSDVAELTERARRGPAGRLPAFKSVAAGAATTVWAAVAPELAAVGGRYLEDCALSSGAARWAVDPVAAERLWALSERLVGESFDPG